MKHLKNNKGMTLIEVIISLIILSLVTVSVSQLMISFSNLYKQINTMASTNILLDVVSADILNEIRHAKGIDELTDGSITIKTNNGSVKYDAEGGRVKKDGVDIYHEDLYKHKSVVLNFGQDDDNGIYSVKITLKGGGSADVARTYELIPLFKKAR